MYEKEIFEPVPPAATDNLGVHYQGPVTAKIAGAKFPPPPPQPPQDSVPLPSSPRPQRLSGKKLVLGGGRRP